MPWGDFRLWTREYPSTWDLMKLHYVDRKVLHITSAVGKRW
uniref:Uncharacterized protein n=1 Tax=Setaria italica TaxID=4555 RepID=K3ZFY8_SETIT